MPATQLSLDFTSSPQPQAKPNVKESDWRDVTDLAQFMGIKRVCRVNLELCAQLSDQALYDALWTAWLSLSLDSANCVLFTLELDGKPVRFKTIHINHALHLGRVVDF